MQITILFIFLLVASSPRTFGQAYVNFSTKTLGDRATMQKRITSAVNSHAKYLNSIRDALKAVIATSPSDQKTVLEASLATIDAIIERRDTSGIANLLPLVDLLHANNTDESPRILGNLENSGVQIGLNYLIDGIYTARMTGAADVVGEQEMESMLRFYAGNPAQTSEGSWQTNNTMLFVFGDRVLNTLATKVPDRIDAFYKAVLDACKSAQSGPGPDEEAIPDAELPTAEQLRSYEASFGKLEALATKGALPKSDPTSQPATAQASAIPTTVPALQPAPKKTSEAKPTTSTLNEEPTSSTPWSVVAVVIVAAIGLLWLLVKKRK